MIASFGLIYKLEQSEDWIIWIFIFRGIEENIESVSGIDIGNSNLYTSLCLQFVAIYWKNEKKNHLQNFSLLELQSQY